MKTTTVRIIILAPLVLIAIAAIAVILYGEAYLFRWADSKAEAALATQVEFTDLDLEISSSSLKFKQVSVFHPERKAEKMGEIPVMVVRLKNLSDLWKDTQAVELYLEKPKIKFNTTRNGEWELAEQIPLIRRGAEKSPLAPYDIDDITVKDGELEFHDGRTGVLFKLSQIQFTANAFRSATSETPLPVTFDAKFILGSGTKVAASGMGDFLSAKTSFQADLKVDGLPLTPYAVYYEAGLPVYVRAGVAYFNAKAKCDQDKLRIPIHASVSGLKVELKKHKGLGFVADDKLDSMKDSRGMIAADLLITGDLQRPKVAFLTKFDAGVGVGMKAVGGKIKSGFGKVKNFFSGN